MVDKRTAVAVVDDNLGTRMALRQLLRSMGFDASTFESAEDFLAANDHDKFDCLVVDLHLPGMNGAALVRKLIDCGIRLPAILITAHDDAPSLKLIRQVAPVPHLHKPFSDTQLSDALRLVLPAQLRFSK